MSRGDWTKPFAVKIGALFSPEGAGEERNIGGESAEFNAEGEVEVSYDLTRAKPTTRNILSLYGDYALGRRRIHFFRENEFDAVSTGTVSTTISGYALGLSGRHYLGTRGRRTAPYVGLGVGLYHQQTHAVESEDAYVVNQIDQPGVEHRVFATESGSHTEVGGKFLIGMEFQSGFLVEVSYQRFPVAGSIHLSGVGLMVGYRL